ncbi:HAMP domain-containing histidine kinase [Tsuneonella sp. YG55]|uniref:histidine kinase n=1 Tax=Tsuneonella litorea TaxID=2976475 RepID=A0A9X2W0X9_9SPHN|nr:HAMP domain-containing sensor histidine kinase [Tsuneonella litorea]MCT2558697.1 HAMP domain-containing histidine kinase [Tsuneonella litorea]
MAGAGVVLARARTDADDRLIEADEPLAGLQRRCGGDLPGTVAVPALLEIVRKARRLGLKVARTIEALDGEETVRAWVEIDPEGDRGSGGCAISIGAWSTTPRATPSDEETEALRIAIDRAVAELSARLDPEQGVLTVDSAAPDLAALVRKMRNRPGTPWTDFVDLPDLSLHQPIHWRLVDGARCVVPGSQRGWTATLVPLGRPDPGSAGFELLLVADAPLPAAFPAAEERQPATPSFGREMTPVLRQPIARIIANAETIRSRLAGPLPEEYSNYAADIAAAGQHLLSLIEDLSDLEVVEAEDFRTAPDRIDLADVARRAVGILGVRARERGTRLEPPGDAVVVPATGEFRRVLQILLNLVGNAISYAPEGAIVRIEASTQGSLAKAVVIDDGPGIPADKIDRVFDKFERLGRGGDGGSGLGLYISRRLARAMGGDLTVDSDAGQGARFTLELPGAD